MAPKLRVLKFTALTCPVCAQMDKRGTLDNLSAEYPSLTVVPLTISDAMGESPAGSPFEEAYALSDELEVSALPTLVVINEQGIEVGRLEGAPTIGQLRKGLDAALEEATAIEAQQKLLPRILAYAAKP